MPAPRTLFVKLSSLGDVIHHLPAVSDLHAHRPDLQIGWVVEEAYAGLVKLHPAVSEVIPIGVRRLRRNPLSPRAWRDARTALRSVSRGHWDYVVDTQGLLKSAFVARRAHAPVFGLDRKTAREGIVARFYDVKFHVPRNLHAVERNRRVVAQVFGYRFDAQPSYGLSTPPSPPAWVPERQYVVLLHAASRAAKRWPGERWIALGGLLAGAGYASILPGGTPAEREAARSLAARIPGAIAAPAMALEEAAALLAHASHVVGVDTGLTHLAVALGRPTVGIYCATRAELTGLSGANGVNLGAPGKMPSVDAVAAALGYVPPQA
ncbi:MAG TPA: lipopolysaccharide heptosyltransferase I [Usitatibacter sp.]|nr:lipopolysaccharide heptosyltransferase I [Usitatibacter sp.]